MAKSIICMTFRCSSCLKDYGDDRNAADDCCDESLEARVGRLEALATRWQTAEAEAVGVVVEDKCGARWGKCEHTGQACECKFFGTGHIHVCTWCHHECGNLAMPMACEARWGQCPSRAWKEGAVPHLCGLNHTGLMANLHVCQYCLDRA